MKKVLSAIMVVAMLLTSAIGVFATEDGTKFIRYRNRYLLTEDGRFYRVSSLYNGNLELLTTDNYLYAEAERLFFQEANGEKSSIHNFADTNHYILTENGVLYYIDYRITEIVCKNVKDFTLIEPDSNGKKTILYRDSECNLYYYDSNGTSTLLLKNCSDTYDGIAWQNDRDYTIWDKMYFAKTNDGQWYHWGLNEDYRLEAEKLIDGNNITPYEFKKPTLATEFIYKYEIKNSKKNIFKTVEWKLDGGLYINNEKIADNICAVSRYEYDRGEIRFTTYDGDVISVDYDGKNFTVSNFDTNFENLHEYTAGIDKNGNFVYIDEENRMMKRIRADYKYMNRSDWADAEIAQADEIGYIDSVKLFDMQSNIKREDFCNMIVDFCETYLGTELPTTTNPFEDTENEKVIKAYANGIIAGVSSDRFAPDDEITREQMCAIMTRASKLLKSDLQFGEGIKFSDMHTVSDWAVEGVNAMSGLGIVKGDGVSITPQSNTSVEQAIAMTYRLYNKIR